jgi:two-component sensor histidine kinase
MGTNEAADQIARLEEDNRRLRRLLDKQDAPSELRHRLNSTLAMLRIIIRKSARTRRDLDDYVAHLEDRVDALARAQSAADAHGVIDFHGLLSDELLYFEAVEGEHVHLDGPRLLLQPRAGQVLALAAHELTVNAIEHGALGQAGASLAIEWSVEAVEPDPVLTLVWKERGCSRRQAEAEAGFGTEVLKNTLGYELNAMTRLETEDNGFLCMISFPLTSRIGHIADETGSPGS